MNRQTQTIVFTIVTVVAAAAVGVLAWNLLSKNGYKTFESETKGFVLKYPSSWTVSQNVKGVDVMFMVPSESSLDTFNENFSVVV